MEFGEKLQELRKNKGLTQEELAEALYVSRTAVSKWESGRGYPNIESLKEISKFFSVTIDELLSGDKILSIAENENKSNIRNMCDLLIGMTDFFSVMLIILPIYPKTVDSYIYSVNLFWYTETSMFNKWIYWICFLGLVFVGVLKLLFVKFEIGRKQKILTNISLLLSSAAVFFLALAREAYALAIIFLLLLIKILLYMRYLRAES